jgi:hypothetical protein
VLITKIRTNLRIICILTAVFVSGCIPQSSVEAPTPSPFQLTQTAPTPPPTFLPTLPSIPPATLTPTPVFIGQIEDLEFEDDFSTKRAWILGEDSAGASSITNEQLIIAIRQAGLFRLVRSPAPELADFYASVEVQAQVCNSGDEYGLVFRLSPNDEHYRFGISCDGEARVYRFLRQDPRAILFTPYNSAIIAGPSAPNQIGVLARGNQFHFFVNEVEIFHTLDNSISIGSFGLFVRTGAGQQATILFDDFQLWSLTPNALATDTP